MDPFFLDEDVDDMPDSAFGVRQPGPMESQASGLPLAQAAVPPAGYGHTGNGAPGDWNLIDDDLPHTEEPAFNGSAAFPGPKEKSAFRLPGGGGRRRRWKWPWQKPPPQEGDRIIVLNNETANDYCSNSVSTSKYNVATFVPKFLTGASLPFFSSTTTMNSHSALEQFSKSANVFFLFTACIQQIPGVSPTNRWTTIAPLGVVLLATAYKEFQEDLVRVDKFHLLVLRHAHSAL
jgi:phospholipid-transporting ATPase